MFFNMIDLSDTQISFELATKFCQLVACCPYAQIALFLENRAVLSVAVLIIK